MMKIGRFQTFREDRLWETGSGRTGAWVRDKKVMICGSPFFACESLRSDTLGKEAYYAPISRRARTSTKGHPRSDSRSRRLPQRIHQRCQRPLRQTVLPLPSARPARSWPELPPDQEGQRQDRDETFSSPAQRRKAQREVEAFHRFRELSRQLLEVNEQICRLRPVAEDAELSPQEKKRPRRSSKKSP